MRAPFRSLAALTAATALCALAACSSSSTGTDNVSLAGNYTLTKFVYAGTDVSQAASGTLTMTATHYTVNVTVAGFPNASIADSGTYTATKSGTFAQTSTGTGVQTAGTYTLSNNVLTVNLSAQGITVVQAWQKQ
ncbi:MAG TPA: hypothetical protein VF737_02645 [Gemmatimonadaceae bacterium]